MNLNLESDYGKRKNIIFYKSLKLTKKITMGFDVLK